MRPGNEHAVIGQELDLHQQEQQNRCDHKRDPSHHSERPTEPAIAEFFWPSKKLDEDIAWQLPLQFFARRIRDFAFGVMQNLMEALRLVGQKDEVHESIGMDHDEQNRREKEEGEQRQFDVEERQLDRVLEEEIGVRHRARGDREIEENEQIGEPQAAADRSRVIDRSLDRLQIV